MLKPLIFCLLGQTPIFLLLYSKKHITKCDAETLDVMQEQKQKKLFKNIRRCDTSYTAY